MGAAILALSSTSVQAQESNTIGPPVLSDFSLRPGNQAAPAEPAPTIAPLPTPPAATREPETNRPAPVVAIPAPAAPTSSAVRQPAAPPQRSVTGSPARQLPAATQPAITGTTAPTFTTPVLPAPADAEPSPAPVTQAPEATPPLLMDPTTTTPQPGSGMDWWLYALFFGLAAGLGFLVLRRRGSPEPALAGSTPARTTRAPVVPSPAEAGPRPWIELDFRPTQAGANDSQAAVQFELTVRNVGDEPAQDIRVEARMFNAGADQDREISAFFAKPEISLAAQAPQGLVPHGEANFKSVVAMPRELVKEVRVNGRRLFIPMVAFNVLYGWEEGSGQTSASYLVGVEGKESERMGPFRLDLGPRIYRAVGHREHRLARRI